ncbi:MAG: fructose-specific PTS transporter subunit EIIC [Lachnospiraceae bacterium]|nr:fructose-specific PTS transporter subunit EIIC [Lachnospiraceae bacterium]
MRIADLLDKRSISLDGAPKSKEEALDRMIALMVKSGSIGDEAAYREQVYEREKEGTTGIGRGLAIPHGKCSAVARPGLAAMVVKDGVDFHSLDGKPVTLIFLIAAPDTEENMHLEVLSRLCAMLMNQEFAEELRNAGSAEEFVAMIEQAEEEKNSEVLLPDAEDGKNSDIRILAVTSCPAGIAHTYMAAEELEKAAKTKGCQIKVETRGSGGVKNMLTASEIAEADCIIVAADTIVPMERFFGKKVLECRVTDGIGKAELLVDQAVRGDVPVYAAVQERGKEKTGNYSGKTPGRQAYMQLMNGVSHMLPFVVGGGILMAIAFLIDGLCVDVNTLDLSARAEFGSITPAAAWFRELGGVALHLMLPVLAGFIGMAIGDRPALAVGFVGGMMASEGKSGFLGAIAAGFLAGYLVCLLRKLCGKLPGTLEKITPVLIYPLFGIFGIGLLMWLIVEPLMGGVNTGLNRILTDMGVTSKAAVGMILGGMMAVDMGGPCNKAAYVFGTAAIASGNYDIMAAVMVGGMTPPCALALASMLFPKKFTNGERENAPAAAILGLSFITEGAIPYAASDPFHVLPSCVIGSAVAGALSMAFGCTLMAPHGGIFVFPVVGNVWMYLISLAAGTAVSAVLLGILKKDVSELLAEP